MILNELSSFLLQFATILNNFMENPESLADSE